MPIARSVFKQSVYNVSAYLLQQHMIEICCKNDTIALSMNSWNKLLCILDKTVFYLCIILASFGMCLW